MEQELTPEEEQAIYDELNACEKSKSEVHDRAMWEASLERAREQASAD